ncbi:MAG: M6 family metalloprotease domain-containing protein [Bacteroidales bacterium]|jgi:M6 family metalloprotease-like protein|nr:M6 family metalloprotease domain-containing protein [Bacteroidales bacterium]MDD2264710.1 M6 family metalloprotease domain-containing protein [Bacteroidales bacterium]MDD2832167.1 M6 family metalloprotease domain-containing protein [Bacteroidales bacterium]MDD3209062.1 M6 family metalloprotease domain-containing protein [Bacteroidales bacterium]MDD3697930.1 M6 family metalloprotease domain-containing protein [Bacteroidales bacterium]
MKNIFLRSLLIVFLTFFSHSAYAVKAYPGPIRVTQPDGSIITIRRHGDEFLNWTTSGDRLVKQGPDGFYYLAEFSVQGNVIATGTRVKTGLQQQDATTITPPAVAVERARWLREKFAGYFSTRSDVSRLHQNLLPEVKGPSSSIAKGEKRFLVILVQFSDLSFVTTSPKEAFFNLLNQDGYAANGATGSVRDYFYENSTGAFDPLFDVIGPVTLSKEVSYYGANNNKGENIFERAREMVVEAVRLADSNPGVDFSQYDNDQDGFIDNVFIYFAGHNEAEGGPDHTIWPHAWTTYDKSINVDGVRTNSYACTSELKGASGTAMAGIGTYCHEFGHVIGLPDFYDTDGKENGEARGLGPFSLMSGGNYNNAGRTPPYLTTVERILLGWRSNEIIAFDAEGDYSLDPVSRNNAFAVATSNDDEFFIYEYRQKTGWDKNVPRSGLLIFHIDMSDNMIGGKTAAQRWRNWDGINNYASHQCCDLIEAVFPESAISFNDQVPFPGQTNNTFFTDTSSPSARDHAGNSIGVYLADIADLSTHATFTVMMSSSLVITGTVTDNNGDPVKEATVTLTHQAAEPTSPAAISSGMAVVASGKIMAMPPKTTGTIDVITTDENGFYYFKAGTKEGTYIITSEKSGYYPAKKEINASRPGTVVVDLTLTRIEEVLLDGILKKHGPWEGYGVGYGSPGGTIYGAVGFSAQELAPYQGKMINSMSFLINGTTASEVGVFVCFGNECAFSGILTNPSFEVMMNVDLSQLGIAIPSGLDAKFGYYVKDSDNGYPLATDNGPMVPMGGYAGNSIESLTATWKEENDIDVNIQISAIVGDEDNLLYSLGYYIISYDPKEYRTGDLFTLKLNDSPSVPDIERPLAVQWYFNDQEHNTGDVITLTAGNHTIRAILTFKNYTQTIVQEIHVGTSQ